jgi:hemerythrin superfamily protein
MMDAIELLEDQHRDVEGLFEEIAEAASPDEKAEIFADIADQLTIHTAIEEMHFYPAVKARQTENLLRESLEEHLAAKRLIADLLDLGVQDEQFDAKIEVLKEMIAHHVKEEEDQLFPAVRKIVKAEELESLAQEMTATQDALLEEEEPRQRVRDETLAAAPLT